MLLINPIWLWGLSGLLIPIGIHLLSRREGKVIRFGSLRHLEESHTKQSINVRLNEVVLLMLRCALIFLIVMLLSGLSIDLFQSQKNQWIILEDGLEQDAGIVSLIDSLKENGFEVKSMAKEFPDASTPKTEPFATYWEMVEELPLQSLSNVIIISRNLSSKFKGKRIALPEKITWIYKEPQPKEFALSRIRLSNDSVLVRSGRSSALQTSFTNLWEPEDQMNSPNDGENDVRTVPPKSLNIAIYSEAKFNYDRKIITASLRAIEETIPVTFNITTSSRQQSPQPDWVIWLSEDTPDQSVVKNANILLMREGPTSTSPLLINATSEGNRQQWFITKRLNEETALQEQLTLTLSSLLTRNDLSEARADSLSQTTLPEESLWSPDKGNATTASVTIDNDKTEQFLLFAIIAVLIAERFVAFKRNA